MSPPIYLDYQSSKPVDPRVVKAMMPFMTEKYGNPSALHAVGDTCTDQLEVDRRTIAQFINADPSEIYFTSGATEANNLAILGYARRNKSKGKHVVISEVEHISIHNLAKVLEREGFEVSRVGVDQYGRVDLRKLERRIRADTILVSIGYASNEIGTIQPVQEIGQLAREAGAAFHTDAVAAEGLLRLDVRRDNVDLMTLSSNDIYGPKGVGALFMRKGRRVNPLIVGGGQERGIRSGTENTPGIVGMAEAARIVMKEGGAEISRLRDFRDKLLAEIPASIPDAHINGHPTERLANNAHFRFAGIEGESLLLSLKHEGISVSTGSACSSKTLEPSHTLISTGLLHEEAHGSLELTVGRFTTLSEVKRVIELLPGIVARLRELSPLYAPLSSSNAR